MSIKCMDRVWSHSRSKGSALLLLLAIADHAHDDGTGAWPSQETLARKTRMSVRQVRRLLDLLAAGGELTIEERPGDTARLTVLVRGDNLSDLPAQDVRGDHADADALNVRPPRTSDDADPGQPCPPTPDTAMSPEPSSNPRGTFNEPSPQARAREPEPDDIPLEGDGVTGSDDPEATTGRGGQSDDLHSIAPMTRAVVQGIRVAKR
jgi:hypothetical protein